MSREGAASPVRARCPCAAAPPGAFPAGVTCTDQVVLDDYARFSGALLSGQWADYMVAAADVWRTALPAQDSERADEAAHDPLHAAAAPG